MILSSKRMTKPLIRLRRCNNYIGNNIKNKPSTTYPLAKNGQQLNLLGADKAYCSNAISCFLLLIACYAPPEYRDALIAEKTGEFLDNVVTFGCITGYLLKGNPSLVCQPNGIWSKREFTCNGKLIFTY